MMRRRGWLVWALLLSAGSAAPQRKAAKKMNTDIPLYQMIRAGDTISIGRIAAVKTEPGNRPGVEMLHIDVQLEETLYGKSTASRHTYSVELPASEVARLKFPDPVWGRVEIAQGVQILVVTPPANGHDVNPVYVDQINDPADPVLRQVRNLCRHAADSQPPAEASILRELQWLGSGQRLEKLFAGESLAKEGAQVRELRGRVIAAYAKAFAAEPDPYIKINLGTWLWEDIFPLADESDQARILNATIPATASKQANVRDFAMDRLTSASPGLYNARSLSAAPALPHLLEERKRQEQDEEVRKHIDDILAALRK